MDVNLKTSNWIQIANGALSLIMQPLLDTFNDGSITASTVATLLPLALDEVYGTLPLDDISLYALLPRDGNYKPETSGYLYSYSLPDKLAYVREVVTEPADAEWKRVRGSILTDAEVVRVRYVQRPSKPSDMPPYCQTLLITLLASKLAGALSHDTSLATSLMNSYSTLLSQYLVLREAPGSQPTYRDTREWF